MTEVAEPSPAPAGTGRTPRRSRTALPFSFVDRALVDGIADAHAGARLAA